MEAVETTLLRVIRILALAGGWGLLAIAVAITGSTIGRKFFGISIQGIDEYGGYTLAIFSAVGFSQALLERGHIRIDIVRNVLGRNGKLVLDIAAHLSVVFASIVLAIAATNVARDSAALQAVSNGPLQTPLVVPQTIWAVALTLFAVLCVFLLIRGIIAVFTRDWNFILQKFGVRSVEEEVSEELMAFKQRSSGDKAAI